MDQKDLDQIKGVVLAAIDTKLLDFAEEQLLPQFNLLHGRIDSVESRLSRVEHRLGSVEIGLGRLEDRFDRFRPSSGLTYKPA